MIDLSEIKLNDFEFWKVDFKKVFKNETTGQISKIVTKLNWFTPIGFTKNFVEVKICDFIFKTKKG